MKDDRKMKGEKRVRQTAKQSCQPLGKLKIKRREEEKRKKKKKSIIKMCNNKMK